MPVNWKKNKKLKPDIILKKIDSIKKVSDGEVVRYSPAFEFSEAMAALHSMIEFPPGMMGLDHEYLLDKAVSDAIRAGELTVQAVEKALNALVKNQLAARMERFSVLTSISVQRQFPFKVVHIDKVRIRILDGNYPQKYAGRRNLVRRMGDRLDQKSWNYRNVIAYVESKSAEQAVGECFRAMDIQRAIWGLFANSSWEMLDDSWNPINKIRLGQVHTVHKRTGKPATDKMWHDPNFVPNKLFSSNSPNFSKNCKWVASRLAECRYSDTVKEALLRYVRALDERDQNTALIHLWSALESLTVPLHADYDLLTRRCSFLFRERDYHHQVLEHLREYRNQNIHSGFQSERVRSNCFQLQYYFINLIVFHMKNVAEFGTLDEANQFLDLPHGKRTLENRKRLIEKAIKFVS
ncbi:MAG: hypothetical protein ABIK83_02250 [Candidatus Zixiibacteriota bacterium]